MDNPNYLGRSGSCTLLKFGNKKLVVCTRHQLGIKPGHAPNYKELNALRFSSFSNKQNLSNIPVENCLFETGNSEQEFHDLLIFRVQENWQGLTQESQYFFPLDGFRNSVPRLQSWFVGYPSSETKIEYEPQNIKMKAVISRCNFDPNFVSSNQFYRRFQYEEDARSMDGFSGGAVFSMVGDVGSFEVIFDGVIVRAGGGYMHIIDADYLSSVAEKI